MYYQLHVPNPCQLTLGIVVEIFVEDYVELVPRGSDLTIRCILDRDRAVFKAALGGTEL